MDFPVKDTSAEVNSGEKEVSASDFDAVAFVKQRVGEVQYLRYGIERVWYRNTLFYIGKQWIKYDNKSRKWVKPNLPEWMPTPITNRFASTSDTIASVLSQVRPTMVFSPSTNSPDDVATADVANAVYDICEDESGMQELEDKLNIWFILTGNAFVYVYYDNDMKYGSVEMPMWACPACGFSGEAHEFGEGICPQCGSQDIQDTGTKVAKPRGRVKAEVLPPFEVYCDLSVEDFDKQPYVMRCRTYPITIVKQRWGDKAKDIKPQGNTNNLGQYYYQSLAYVTNSGDSGFGNSSEYGGQNKDEQVTIWEVFIPASATMPEGYHGFVCNDVELSGGPLEYHRSDGAPFIPIVHYFQQATPRRLFAKSIVDDLVHKQIQRNKLEAFLQLALHRTSNPVWLLPESCGIENISGEPGEIVRYNDSNTANAKPERLGGVELTQSVFRWLEKIDRDFEELASTYDILKGEVPPNVPTLGGLELLKERAIGRFTRMIRNYENSKKKVARMFLDVWREYATEKRTRVFKDPSGKWKQEQFDRADLRGSYDIRVEPGSSSPRSEAHKQLIAGQLLERGLIDPSDIATRMKLMDSFHAKDFSKTLEDDVNDAIREEKTFLESGITRLRADIDNHHVHLSMHMKFAKSEDFWQLQDEMRILWERHIIEHKQMFAQQMGNMQMSQGAAPQMEA